MCIQNLVGGQDNDVWYKVGQALGNLQALKVLFICTYDRLVDDDDDVESPTPDWKILVRILSQVRQKITLDVTNVLAWDTEESQALARVIRGHPIITCFQDSSGMDGMPPYESLDTLYSALATLLRNVTYIPVITRANTTTPKCKRSCGQRQYAKLLVDLGPLHDIPDRKTIIASTGSESPNYKDGDPAVDEGTACNDEQRVDKE